MNNVAAAVKLNAHWKGFFLTRSPHAQPMAIHDAGNLLFISKHGGVDPRVPRLAMDHDVGALGTEQLAIGKNLEIAIHEMPVRAVLILRARRQADRHVRVHSAKLCDSGLQFRRAIPEMPVKLFVDVGREELVR